MPKEKDWPFRGFRLEKRWREPLLTHGIRAVDVADLIVLITMTWSERQFGAADGRDARTMARTFVAGLGGSESAVHAFRTLHDDYHRFITLSPHLPDVSVARLLSGLELGRRIWASSDHDGEHLAAISRISSRGESLGDSAGWAPIHHRPVQDLRTHGVRVLSVWDLMEILLGEGRTDRNGVSLGSVRDLAYDIISSWWGRDPAMRRLRELHDDFLALRRELRGLTSGSGQVARVLAGMELGRRAWADADSSSDPAEERAIA